jgi:methyltransferase (TIGR00027 family)
MNQTNGQTSETALGVLTFLSTAATDPNLAVRFDDPIAPQLIRWSDGKYVAGKIRRFHPGFRKKVERSDPGAYGFMIARALHMDDVIRREVADGLGQLVILGAGYDTRAYRMRDELAGAKVLEVDLSAMSRDKRARLKKALGSVPGQVTYVEADFTRQDLLERLAENGYDDSSRTLFVLSGVSMYLPEEAVLALFSQVAQSSPGASILFDYFFEDLMTDPGRYHGGPEWIARANMAGEEPQYGVAMDQIGARLASRGLRLTSQSDAAELAERYLRGADGAVAVRPYEFAAVAHAVVED